MDASTNDNEPRSFEFEAQTGPLLFLSKTGKFQGLNKRYIAEYFSHVLQLRFCVKKNSFIEYDNKSGEWSCLSDNRVYQKLWDEYCL